MLQYTVNEYKSNLDRLPTQTIRLRRNASRAWITALHGVAVRLRVMCCNYRSCRSDMHHPKRDGCMNEWYASGRLSSLRYTSLLRLHFYVPPSALIGWNHYLIFCLSMSVLCF